MNRFLIVTVAVFLAVSSLPGAVIFSDDFEGHTATANTYTPINAPATFGSWSVTFGSVDILNNTLTCHSGIQCMDMDGTATFAGTMSTSFSTIAGLTYTLNFYYSGNQRGAAADTMSVNFGTQSLSLNNIAASTPWTLATLSFVAGGSGTQSLTFTHAGGDWQGILLDDVTITDNQISVGNVPEPSTLLLCAAGLAFAAMRKR